MGKTSGPPKKRRAEGRFQSFIQSQEPVDGALPLTHITRAYTFDDMLDGDGIEPQYCEVLKEDLVYLFYGRPAYRARDGNNARLEFEWPIVLIFNPDKVEKIKCVFPFDTGAFVLNVYKDFFDKSSKLEDFSLPPSLESARRVVGTYYQDNREYYSGYSRKNVNIPHRQYEAEGVLELASLPGVQDTESAANRRDERSAAIEVQTDEAIAFKGALIAVLLPEPYLNDDEIKEALQRWDVQNIETYETLHNLGGEAWVGQFYAKVQQLYKRLGFL